MQPYHTPLRYPGGKRRLADVVKNLLDDNELRDVEYAEPFAGGGAVAFELLFSEYASRIHLNDLSRPVYAIWHTILNDTEWLCKRLRNTTVTMTQWYRQRCVYKRRDTADLSELGFAALFLNRTNRSGIIGGGVIGGKAQAGDWSLDVRFNGSELAERIKKIARYRDRIKLYSMEAQEFTTKVAANLGPKSFLFYDPPYIDISRCLYLNTYRVADHHRLAKLVASKVQTPWIVTYDFPAVKESLYSEFRRIVYGLHYTAQRKYKGREVMYLSHDLELRKVGDLLGSKMHYIPSLSRIAA